MKVEIIVMVKGPERKFLMVVKVNKDFRLFPNYLIGIISNYMEFRNSITMTFYRAYMCRSTKYK